MWTVIYVSQSPETAKKLADALNKNGIVSKVRQSGGDGESQGCCEVLVPDTEMEAAQDLIIENDLF